MMMMTVSVTMMMMIMTTVSNSMTMMMTVSVTMMAMITPIFCCHSLHPPPTYLDDDKDDSNDIRNGDDNEVQTIDDTNIVFPTAANRETLGQNTPH